MTMRTHRYVGVKPKGRMAYIWDMKDKVKRYESKYWGRILKELDKLNELWEGQQKYEELREGIRLQAANEREHVYKLMREGGLTESEQTAWLMRIAARHARQLKDLAARQMMGVKIPSKEDVVKDIPAGEIPF